MLIEIKRTFFSNKLADTKAGNIVECDEKYGKHLIEYGLAVAYTAGPSLSSGDAGSSFPLPVGADQPGSSSPAGQVLPEKIANMLGGGAKKVTYRKSGKSRS